MPHGFTHNFGNKKMPKGFPYIFAKSLPRFSIRLDRFECLKIVETQLLGVDPIQRSQANLIGRNPDSD